MADNNLTAIPPALLAATGLRSLVLRDNCTLRPTCADVARLLRAMPGLTSLDLSGTYGSLPPPAAVLEFVRRVGPRLKLITNR